MIRRISKKNDLRDLIKSCPTGVIDDIHTIKYFIAGHQDDEYEATFTKTGEMLEVILPSSALEELSSGLLMRRALYSVEDPSFPDGHYDLEFVDNLNVWLGDDDVDLPFDPGWLTEEDLKTINGVSLVGTGDIDIADFIPEDYATKSWVSTQTGQALSGYATQTWVQGQGYLTEHQDLSSYATKQWIGIQDYAYASELSSYATQSWVLGRSYLTSTSIVSYVTQQWISEQGYASATDLTGYATKTWVQDQGYITSQSLPEGIATQSWVSNHFVSSITLNSYVTQSWISQQGYASAADLNGYATREWVQAQGYITSESIPGGIATQSWVQSYVSSQSFVTQSWIQSQGYASATDLSEYATKSWVSSNYFEESKIWTGTSSQWGNLTPEQQELYTIALITE